MVIHSVNNNFLIYYLRILSKSTYNRREKIITPSLLIGITKVVNNKLSNNQINYKVEIGNVISILKKYNIIEAIYKGYNVYSVISYNELKKIIRKFSLNQILTDEQS